MKRLLLLLALLLTLPLRAAESPVEGLLERICPGASQRFVTQTVASDTDFFELSQQGDKVVVSGNNPVSIAAGVNWYLKYHAGIHLTWNNMQAQLPTKLPPVIRPERHEVNVTYRYALNYCTFSYTMAFWDWARWEREIDWMALHGINLALAVTGTETVWRNLLRGLGYDKTEISEFVAGPGFTAWWLMNNLEGWGGPNPERRYRQQAELQRRILGRMRELGIQPVLPGYCGMVPHNAAEKLGLEVADPGTWCGFRRPAFLQPEDPRFQEIATRYYAELEKLYGKAAYYSMDPFHEGGNVAGVNLAAAGQAVMQAMKRANPDAVWVAQAWQENPRRKMTEGLNKGDLLILDLFAESRPLWGKGGFGKHDWVFCMLLNYGGNVGLHGKMQALIDGYAAAKADSRASQTLLGVGMTAEGIENNPVMFELLTELPWRKPGFDKQEWLDSYVFARYGASDPALREAWHVLGNSIYDCPRENTQQGTNESVFCARPDLHARQASTWAASSDYYAPQAVQQAAELLLSVADAYRGNSNFEYDLIDICRQALAEKGRQALRAVEAAAEKGDIAAYDAAAAHFLELLLGQDELLASRPEFRLDTWLAQARSCGKSRAEKALYEWNARVQITTWGDRTAADEGGLHDYAHKEWSGLLREFYYPRWKLFFERERRRMQGENPADIDFYAMESAWTKQTSSDRRRPTAPAADCIGTARRVMQAAR